MKALITTLSLAIATAVAAEAKANCDCDYAGRDPDCTYEFLPAIGNCHAVDSSGHPVQSQHIDYLSGTIRNLDTNNPLSIRCALRGGSYGTDTDMDHLSQVKVYLRPGIGDTTSSVYMYEVYIPNGLSDLVDSETGLTGGAYTSVSFANLSVSDQFLAFTILLSEMSGTTMSKLHGFRMCYDFD